VDRSLTRRALLALAATGAVTACGRGTGLLAAPGRPRWSATNLGLNYAWLNDHRGNQRVNWLAEGYDVAAVEADLDMVADMGVRILRAFCPIESVFAFDGSRFLAEGAALANLRHFLAATSGRGISLIPVMADGNASAPPRSHDGKFRWQFAGTDVGLAAYRDALRRYVDEVGRRVDVVCWQTFNEPYATVAGSDHVRRLGIGADAAHRYLCAAYDAVKSTGVSSPVAFSDLHEEEQPKYRLFTDPVRRKRFVDDCTDVYALHLFRSRVDELPDLSDLTDRPKWCVELGNSNYRDATGEFHGGRPAALELHDEHENARAVQTLGAALVETGFSLVLPWSLGDNPGFVAHEPDGSHTYKRLATWMRRVLRTDQASSDS
jgi:hypothetical protein